VQSGARYLGWSAGSVVACPSIRTTNDMPIVEPPAFAALSLVPFQINAHYTEAQLPNHNGETRPERLQEFLAANPESTVAALPEGTGILVDGAAARLIGTSGCLIYHGKVPPESYPAGADVSFLLGTAGQ
ncbi:MAG TPA: dipeptidase PepE, partial [Gemmatimonadales bacterium]|nr:dipeptidase PepE [Gemmatimonadales bacterium]